MEHSKHMERRVQHYVAKTVKVVFIALFILGVFLLIGWAVKWLWNSLMPELFGLTTITYWQAVGILVLAKILFGFGTGSKSHSSGKKNRWKSNGCGNGRIPLENWKYYDEFWKEEGEKAFTQFVARKEDGTSTETPPSPSGAD